MLSRTSRSIWRSISRNLGTAVRHPTFCLIALMLTPAAAGAQTRDFPINVTGFAGLAMVPGPHAAVGLAVGVRPRPGPVSLEFEYARSRSDRHDGVPGVMTFAGNILVQWRMPPSRVQFYGTLGVGLYAMSINGRSSEPNDARNVGGGIKVELSGPLKLRLDYRAIRLAPISGEYHSNEQRVSVGLVAGF